ncbi:MAG: hypothetical protein HY360_08590 [Verrucomicrobia bacterium]|nr:hypothetical protein [Verrucomicrobiota bacterium]
MKTAIAHSKKPTSSHQNPPRVKNRMKEFYQRFIDQGFSLLLVGGDEWMLNGSCRKLLAAVLSAQG